MGSPDSAEGNNKSRKMHKGRRLLQSGRWADGTSDTEEAAAMGFDEAALRLKGSKAVLNFPERAKNTPTQDYGSHFSGVSHDLRFPKKQTIPGSGRVFLHRRLVIGSCRFLPAEINIEAQIHHIEQQACTSVLRAFITQSDAITRVGIFLITITPYPISRISIFQVKKSLFTELRKEVGVSDEEHQELLFKVNGEEIINEIREWRAASGLQLGMPSISRPVQDRESHSTVSSSRVNHDLSPSSGQFLPAQNHMETLIHQIEKEAYTSIVRAFEAQSDITWDEDQLITSLRKELRVSEEEHQELLIKVNAEEILNEIREWRIASGHNQASGNQYRTKSLILQFQLCVSKERYQS